jgi:hypothetical protein
MSWAKDEIIACARAFHGPGTDFAEDVSTLSNQDILTIGCALTIKGVQHTTKNINQLNDSIVKTNATVGKVGNELSTVSSRVNAVSHTVTKTVNPATFASVVAAAAKAGTPSAQKPLSNTSKKDQKSTVKPPAKTATTQQSFLSASKPKTYSASERRMYCTFQTPMEIVDNRLKTMVIPQTIAAVLKNFNVPPAAL